MKRIEFDTPLLLARVIDRPNRFIVNAELDGIPVRTHCPSTGRIGDFPLDGLPCLLSGPYELGQRSTAYTIEAFARVEPDDDNFQWIGINQTRMNWYVEQALRLGYLNEAFHGIVPSPIHRERKLGSSRIDFFVNDDTWIEVKMPLTMLNDQPSEASKAPPRIGIDRMVNQLKDLTTALNAGQRALMIAAFAYDAGGPPGAIVRRHRTPLPAIVTAQAAGLERWQLNLSLHETHATVQQFFPT